MASGLRLGRGDILDFVERKQAQKVTAAMMKTAAEEDLSLEEIQTAIRRMVEKDGERPKG